MWSVLLLGVLCAASNAVVGVAPGQQGHGAEPDFNVTDYVSALADADGRLLERAVAALSAEMGLPPPLGCPAPPPCPPDKYRTMDGSCNNVRHPAWGAAGAPFLRLLAPEYEDGSRPKASPPMPSPERVVAALRGVSAAGGPVHEHVTALVALWGELLLRDIALPVSVERGGCCGAAPAAGPECFPLTSGSQPNATCKDYVRSLPALHDDCNFQHRDQMNMATGFLDASSLYGNSDEEAQSLRAPEGGLVILENCRLCQTVGSGLSTLASLFLREHNRLAVRLAALNPHWDSDTLFLEARRLVAAQLQHITYSEFLPTVLGEVTMESWDLTPRDHGHYTGYSSGVHAGALAEVGVAALHAFRSMVPPALVSNTTAPGRMDALDEGRFTRMVHAVTSSPALRPSLRMAAQPRADYRQDWEPAALLLHRGRDHGLASYPNWVSFCTQGTPLTKKANFSFLGAQQGLFTEDNLKHLKSVYKSVGDVDLLAGASLETPAQGAVLGPTMGCLLAEQFSVLRAGDRFWYENDIPPSSFSRVQLDEIRRVTLGGVICANTPDLSELQPQAFVREDPYLNVRIACGLQPSLQLSTAWKDQRSAAAAIPEDLVREAVQRAEKELTARAQFEYRMWADKGAVDPKSPQGTAAAFSKANKQALHMANSSLLLEFASEELLNSLQSGPSAGGPGGSRRRRQIVENLIGFTRDDILSGDGLQDIDVRPFVTSTPLDADPSMCAPPVAEDGHPCDPTSPFRTFSGHCNNQRKPSLGKSLTTFNRLLPPAYENGVSRPRLTSVTGAPLPSPRLVSTMVHADISNLHTRYSLMVMQFAQFLDHDLTFTPVHRGFFASIPDCRSCDSPRTVHPECMPIPVPAGDHFYPPVNQTTGERLCFPFMRSLPGQQHLGPRDQINQNSAFLDGSVVYGEQACLGRDLRAYVAGRLNVTIHPVRGKDLLPQSPSHPECRAPSGYCFIAGDARASEQPALTAMHTVWMREHNRLVDGLHAVNPHWDDERLYQHGRRILSAALQHISYNEFLPRILGWNAVNLYGLKLQSHGYYKGYSPTCNPAILNEFATAAFRIGHSLLRPHIPRMSPSYKPIDPPLLLRDGFFNPDAIYQAHIVDEIMRGLVSTPMENLDQFITGEITNHLFEDRRIPHSGIDLAALNIQRGRDHAIRPYNDYRALCNLKRATTWDDLSREIPAEVIARLQRMYPTVDDIDLFPGGLSERPLQGGLVGPTFACIIGIQFRQIRKCDRFWYENDDPVTRFTEAQLAEIRKATLSKVLCANLDAESDMQRSALDQPNNFLNPRLPCHSLPGMDLNAWRETHQGCHIGGRSVAVGESALPSPCTSCICTEEGAQCASLRITDCGQLMREASRDSILRDDVCMAQCGFLLEPLDGAAPASGPGLGPDLGSSQHIEFTTAPSRRPPGAGRQLPPPELLGPPPPPPFRRGPGGPPPPRAARRNPRVFRPGPSAPGFSGLRIPDFSSIIG